MKTENIMNLSKKVVLTAAVGFFTSFGFAQSLQDGINFVDSQKYAKAKQNYTDLINQNPNWYSRYKIFLLSVGVSFYYRSNEFITSQLSLNGSWQIR